MRTYPQLALAGLMMAATAPLPAAAMSAILSPSMPSPAPVGTMVTWNASVLDANDGVIWYRFRARQSGGDYQLIRDYGPETSLDWTTPEHEGSYEVELSVRNPDTGETAAVSSVFQMTSLVPDGKPAVTPTSHPLVFRYSAPACDGGRECVCSFGDPMARFIKPPARTANPDSA